MKSDNIRNKEPNQILLLCFFLTNVDAYETIKIATTDCGVLSEVELYFLICFCFGFVTKACRFIRFFRLSLEIT